MGAVFGRCPNRGSMQAYGHRVKANLEDLYVYCNHNAVAAKGHSVTRLYELQGKHLAAQLLWVLI